MPHGLKDHSLRKGLLKKLNLFCSTGLPQWLRGKESTCNAGVAGEGAQPLGWEDPWRRAWQPTLVFCLENSMYREAWWATQSIGSQRVRQD